MIDLAHIGQESCFELMYVETAMRSLWLRIMSSDEKTSRQRRDQWNCSTFESADLIVDEIAATLDEASGLRSVLCCSSRPGSSERDCRSSLFRET